MDVESILDQEPGVIAEKNWRAYVRDRDDGHTKYVEQAKLYDRYYVGGDDQWDPDVVALLDKEHRPHHTVNLVLSTINAAIGQYINQRQDIDYKPQNGDANDMVARTLTKLAQHVSNDSHSRWVEKQVVTDGFIQDRGYFEIRLDTEENVGGEVRELSLDPIDVVLDAGAREYDPSTWSRVTQTKWLTPDQIRATYGEKIADQLTYMNSANTFGTDSVQLDPETFARVKSYYTNGGNTVGQAPFADDWNRTKRLRVICTQYYKFTIRRYLVDNITGDIAPAPDSWDLAKMQAVAQQYNLSIMQKPERRVRWTHSCDKFLLYDAWSPYRRFNIIPYFPYFRRGRPFGIVRNLISPQDLLNKVSSQELHVVNTTANSGWMIESGTLVNMTVDELRAVGAKTGLVLEYQRGATPPEKIQPNQIPTGLDRLSQKATVYFREISGISDAMLGQPGREISGDALQRKQQSGLMQLDTVFDNLAYTRQLRAEFMLELFQDFYTEERVLKIIGFDDEGQEVPEELKINQQQATGEILNDITVGEYRVVVSSRPSRDTEDETQTQLMLQMREAGVMIPDWAIIEASPLERRREIAEWNRKMTGATEPTPEEIQFSQMQQELMLRRQVAELDELAAKTQERLGNAAKAFAEAEATGASQQSEIIKFGAELRQSMEKDLLAFQQKREELMTRIQISEQKNQANMYQAQLAALTKRLDTESTERVAQINANAKKYGK